MSSNTVLVDVTEEEKSKVLSTGVFKVGVLSKDVNKLLNDYLRKQKPTDQIIITDESEKFFLEQEEQFTRSTRQKCQYKDMCSADIIWAHTIPIMDMELNIVTKSPIDEVAADTLKSQCKDLGIDLDSDFVYNRVHIVPDYIERLNDIRNEKSPNESAVIGFEMFRVKPFLVTWIVPVGVSNGSIIPFLNGIIGYKDIDISVKRTIEFRNINEYIDCMDFDPTNLTDHGHSDLKNALTVHDYIMGRGYYLYRLWYGIQLSLLNPVVSDVFRHPRTVVIDETDKNKNNNNTSNNNKKKKKKVRYIKRHVININDIDRRIDKAYNVLCEHDTSAEDPKRKKNKSYNRKTMIWWNIGHWRNYEGDRKVFVEGFWKGPLREIMNNNENVFDDNDTRIRDIPLETTTAN